MGFAPTWLRQVSPPPHASQNHFNHWPTLVCMHVEKWTTTWFPVTWSRTSAKRWSDLFHVPCVHARRSG